MHSLFDRALALIVGWLCWGIVVFLILTMIHSPFVIVAVLAPFALLLSLLAFRLIAEAILGDN